MKRRGFLVFFAPLITAGLLAGCSGSNHGVVPATAGGANNAAMSRLMPKSVSPALIKVPPMVKTPILPSSAMRAPRKIDVGIQPLGWTQLPGVASQVVAVADGSIWVLSDQPAGPDKYIWHYVLGTWTNIPGLASEIAATPSGELYAINSTGATYLYQGGTWTSLGGGARDVTAAADGSTYVLSNGGSGPDYAIWHNVKGTWTQVPGAGVKLAANWDTRNYKVPGGNVSPGGFYVINAAGDIFYGNSDGSYASFPGSASDIAPSTYGGIYVLGYPTSANGETIYYYNLDTPGWTALPGMARSISEAGAELYAVTSAGYIYESPAQAAAGPALTNTNSSGYPYWGPYDVAANFQYPVQSGYDGMGETVAIVISAYPDPSDLSTYLSTFSITRRGSFATEAVDGGGYEVYASAEATMDSETIAGLAPGANVILYDTPDIDDQHLIDAYNQILSDGKANIVSMSYGECEYQGIDTTIAPLFAQMAAQGIAAVAAAGDTGNECDLNGYSVGPLNPASDPNVIGVGGVETGSSTSGESAIVGTAMWNDCPTPLSTVQNCMSGGGVSGNTVNGFAGYHVPSYQQNLTGEASATLRNVPDISMPADNDLFFINVFAEGYGTSWGAPQTAALLAEIYQYCGVNAIANPVNIFYTAFAQDGYKDFYDVTSGNDSYMGTTPSYTAAAGFDNVGGIGQPLGMPIAQRICPNNRPTLVRQAAHQTVALQTQAPAVARVLQNVVNVANMQDMGERDALTQTRVTFVLRATANLTQNEQKVVGALQSAGFTIVRRFSNHLVVDAQAPASVVERYFNTRLHNYVQGRYGTRYANTQPDTLPGSIAPYVNGVMTQNLVLARIQPQTNRIQTALDSRYRVPRPHDKNE